MYTYRFYGIRYGCVYVYSIVKRTVIRIPNNPNNTNNPILQELDEFYKTRELEKMMRRKALLAAEEKQLQIQKNIELENNPSHWRQIVSGII